MTNECCEEETMPPEPESNDKWYPGHYVKLQHEQVVKSDGSLNLPVLDDIFNEQKNTYCLRGVKWVIEWGNIECKTTEADTWNWKVINELAKRCWKLRQGDNPKYTRLMIAINLEAHGTGTSSVNGLMPPDLVQVSGSTYSTEPSSAQQAGYYAMDVDSYYGADEAVYGADTYAAACADTYAEPDLPATPDQYATAYTKYTKCYPWTQNGGSPDGYYIKLWETGTQDRLGKFCQALANHVVPDTDGKTLDEGDILCMVTTLESATSNPYDGYQGGSKESYEDGLFAVNKKMKGAFKKTPVTMGLNYDRPLLEEYCPKLQDLCIGMNTPNVSATKGLSQTADPQGMHLYYKDQKYYNNVLLTCETQGDDYKSSKGIDARKDKFGVETPPGYDFPSYQSIYERHRDVLHVHYIVWQRNLPFWLGGVFSEALVKDDPSYVNGNKVTWPYPPNKVPPVLKFLQSHPPLNDPKDPAGGLNSTKPPHWI